MVHIARVGLGRIYPALGSWGFGRFISCWVFYSKREDNVLIPFCLYVFSLCIKSAIETSTLLSMFLVLNTS
jgi:hypothetical protein